MGAEDPAQAPEPPGNPIHPKAEAMEKIAWICLSLVSLFGPLWALPGDGTSQASSWLPETDTEGRFLLEALGNWNRRSLRQNPLGLPGASTEAQTWDSPRQAGLRPSSFKPRESIKEALLGNLPRTVLLKRLLPAKRKPLKKRGNLSECFWKYCV